MSLTGQYGRNPSDVIREAEKTSYLYVEYLREFQAISKPPCLGAIIAFNRRFSELLSLLCCIDVCSRRDQEARADWSSPEDVKHLMDYNPVVDWKLFPGPITIGLRWLGVRPFKCSAWKQRLGHHWMSQSVRVFYFLCNFHLLVNLYYQYSYDFDRIKALAASKELQAEKQRDRDKITELKLHLVLLTNRLRETKSMLDLVGSPNSNSSFTVECFYLYTIICAFTIYYVASLFYGVVTQFDIHVSRELMDAQDERHHFDRLVRSQVSKYLDSYRTFAEVSLQRGAYSMNLQTVRRATKSQLTPVFFEQSGHNQIGDRHDQLDLLPRSGSFRPIQPDVDWADGSRLAAIRAILAKLKKNFSDTRDSLNLMLACGALKPANKAPSHLDRRSVVMIMYIFGLFVNGTLLVCSLLYWSFLQSDPSRPLCVQDFLLLTSLLGLFGIAGFSVNFLATYFFTTCLDQIVAANKVRELVVRCIRANSMAFYSYAAASNDWRSRERRQQDNSLACRPHLADRGGDMVYERCSYELGTIGQQQQSESWQTRGSRQSGHRRIGRRLNSWRAHHQSNCEDTINTNLLFVLMQYKIFVAQYMPFKTTFESFPVYMTIFSILMPSLLRIHLAYMDTFIEEDTKLFIMIWSLGTLPLAEINSVPVCHLYSRCTDVYRALASLLAHTIAIESDPDGRGLYNQHAVNTLIKELEHPSRMMEQFKTGSLGLTWTYATLVKTQFWRGLIVLSMLADKQFSEQGLFGAIFRDPFDLF